MKKLAEIEQILCTFCACERSALSEYGTTVVWSNSLMYPLEHRQIEERDPLEAHEDHWIDVGASATNDVAPPRQIARRRVRGGDLRGGRRLSG
jgi:hypothetical protein